MSIVHTNKIISTGLKGILFLFLVFQIISPGGFAYAAQPQPPPAVPAQTEDLSVATTCDTSIEGYLSGQVIVCGILLGLNNLADSMMSMPLGLAESAVRSALEKNRTLKGSDSFIEAGWPVVRDISNIFFVFILLWIALATIFDVETYSAKKLLPKFIISALLINFSLPIAIFIISLSNQIGETFFSQLDIPASVGRISAPAQQIAKVTGIVSAGSGNGSRQEMRKKILEWVGNANNTTMSTKSFDNSVSNQTERTLNFTDCTGIGLGSNPEQIDNLFNPGTTVGGSGGRGGFRSIYPNTCAQIDLKVRQYAANNNLSIYDTAGINQTLARAIVIKFLILPVIIFVLLAVAVLLIVRYISLLFIVVLGPFAFLSMILPATEYLSNQWWEKLVKWSLFSPAFAICFLISIKTMDNLNEKLALTKINGIDVPLSGATFIDYLLSIGFMIGSLLVAQELGIHGAGAVTNMGKKAAGAVGNWAKRGALAPVRLAGANISEGARIATGTLSSRVLQGSLGEIPGLRTLAAKGAGVGKIAQDARYKRQYGDNIKDLSDEDKARYMEVSSPKAAGQMLTKMKEDERAKVIGKMSSERKSQFIEKIGPGKQGLVTSATNNPEDIVNALDPYLKQTDPKKYGNEVITQLQKMNPRTLSPEFIANTSIEVIQSLSPDMAQKIASTPDGARALSQRLNFLTPQEKNGLNKNLNQFLGTTPGGALLRGTTLPSVLSPEEITQQTLSAILQGQQTAQQQSNQQQNKNPSP